MLAKIYVKLKAGLLDVQGKTVKSGLDGLGFTGIQDVRVGKYIEIDFDTTDAAEAQSAAEAMCEKLLTNPVIEIYQIQIETPAKK